MFGLLILLMATNPTLSDFNAHTPKITPDEMHWKRANLFICSIYSDDGEDYLGILGNFFRL